MSHGFDIAELMVVSGLAINLMFLKVLNEFNGHVFLKFSC